MNYVWSKVKLRKSKDFQKVIKKGRKIANNSFVIFSFRKNTPNNSSDCCKIGISVPQKILRKSNQRNKCKRQIKSIINKLAKEKLFTEKLSKWEIVIVLRKDYLRQNFEEKRSKMLDLVLFLLRINKKLI